MDLISRQAAIDAVYESAVGRQMLSGHKDLLVILKALPSAQPEVIYCKDCKNQNVGIDDEWSYLNEVCPLVQVRGKAKGHEFDYQYCVWGRKE